MKKLGVRGRVCFSLPRPGFFDPVARADERTVCRPRGSTAASWFLRTGEEVEFGASRGVITIVPKPPNTDADYTLAQRRMIDARLAIADEDISAGRVYGPFNTPEEMAASIEANIRKLRVARRKTKRAR